MIEVVRPAAVVTDLGITSRPDGAPLYHRLAMRQSPAAYVSFTSGSTGEPKAVVTEQRSIVNYIDGVRLAYGIGPGIASFSSRLLPSILLSMRYSAR